MTKKSARRSCCVVVCVVVCVKSCVGLPVPAGYERALRTQCIVPSAGETRHDEKYLRVDARLISLANRPLGSKMEELFRRYILLKGLACLGYGPPGGLSVRLQEAAAQAARIRKDKVLVPRSNGTTGGLHGGPEQGEREGGRERGGQEDDAAGTGDLGTGDGRVKEDMEEEEEEEEEEE
ncbi:unnamed protein product [Symbiodinium microadriaticum]|nr:unnamed protein product [Symbiodinium microadriaticum]